MLYSKEHTNHNTDVSLLEKEISDFEVGETGEVGSISRTEYQ